MYDSAMTRFFGGSPLTVAVRLVVVSLLVGLVMTWLQIDPMDLFLDLQRGFVRLWGTGFVALHQIGNTVLAGAAVVVPVWFVLRVLSYRGPRSLGSHRQQATRPETTGHEAPRREAARHGAPRWGRPMDGGSV